MSSPQNRIRWFREAEDLTPRQLSVKLDATGNGPHERTIIRWERGEGGVPDKWKFALADLFGVSVAYLMGWDDQPVRPEDRTERAAA